jgi:DNA repair exonuclease SbcCD ATPase subunit
MRFAMILLILSACGSSEKKPATAPANQVEPGTTAPPPPTRDAELEKAQREADQARKEAADATERVERLAKDLEELDAKLTAAIDSVVAAQNDADRAAAKAKLEQLRKEKAEMEARVQAARGDAAKATRKQGPKISKECQENPLAKGCP